MSAAKFTIPSAFAEQVKRETFEVNCCRRVADSPEIPGYLELDLSTWAAEITEEFLASCTKPYDQISLKLVGVPVFSNELCDMLGKLVGPKLFELEISDCQSFSWKQLKRILEKCSTLRSVKFIRDPWLDDYVFEQICSKFFKTLKSMHVEHAPKMTDNALHHLARKCGGIRNLYLDCCTKVTDAGLIEISKRIHLCNVSLSHNTNITDAGVEALVSAGQSFSTIKLVNCPRLTDRAASTIYEATAAWGRKRNTKTNKLLELDFSDNPHISASLFQWIATAAPYLQSLQLRDCPNMALSQRLVELQYMDRLERLSLGPGLTEGFDKLEFVDAMCFLSPRLRSLHLTGISQLDDDCVGAIISECLVLEDFSSEDIDVGTATVESLCSFVPNILRVGIIGSSFLEDIALRCLSAICRNLKQLKIQRCSQITDAGFSRCLTLKLDVLDVQHPTGSVDGNFLACFPRCPLKELYLSGGRILTPSSGIVKMQINTTNSLEKVHLQYCPALALDDVVLMLKRFVYCKLLDLTGCLHLMPAVASLKHPFMNFSSTVDFMGFKCDHAGVTKMNKYRESLLQIKKHIMAKKLQKMFHNYEARLIEIAKENSLARKEYKLFCQTKLQATGRMYLCRKQYKRCIRAILTIQCVIRGRLLRELLRKSAVAKAHYKLKLKRIHFNKSMRFTNYSKKKLAVKESRVVEKCARRAQRRYFYAFLKTQGGNRDQLMLEAAYVIYEEHLLRSILRGWHTVIGETKRQKHFLTRLFMMTTQLKTDNSSRQLSNRAVAEHFYRRHLLVPAYLAFCDSYYRALKADALTPIAKKFALKMFTGRVLVPTYKAMVQHALRRRKKHTAEARGGLQFQKFKKLIGCRRFWKFADKTILFRQKDMKSDTFRHVYPLQVAVNNFQHNVFHMRFTAVQDEMSHSHGLETHLIRFHAGVKRIKAYTKLNHIAAAHRKRKIQTDVIQAWHMIAAYSSNMEEYVIMLRSKKIKRKIFQIFIDNVAAANAYKEEVKRSLIEKGIVAEEEGVDPLAKFSDTFTVFQAHVRGKIQRRKYRNLRVSAVWATQILQNLVRRGLANKEWRRRWRKEKLLEAKREEQELDLMRQNEQELRFFYFHETAATNIQRTFRGYKGRERALNIAAENRTYKGTKFYNHMVKLREDYVVHQRLLKVMEIKRQKAATLIQAAERGHQARTLFKSLKRDSNRDKYVVFIQRVYRGHLARLLLDSIRRKNVHDIRFNAARRQRGFILRALGFKKKKGQNAFSRNFLEGAGWEPISFNYRVKEVWQDIVADYHQFVGILKREYDIYQETKGARVLRLGARRRRLLEAGANIKRYDAVIIIDKKHRYYGYTGLVMRVDINVAGEPLYEIKLDALPKLTFVHMTTDALSTYLYDQPLSRITRRPNMDHYLSTLRPILFGISENPEHSRERVSAAWVIQRGYRCHVARKRVARRRFELWTRRTDLQRSIIQQMSETNTLTTQAYYLTGRLNLRPKQNIIFTEVRHSLYPERINASKQLLRMGPAIKKEYADKYKGRIRYLEKAAVMPEKGAFMVGWRHMNIFRKLGSLLGVGFGYSLNGAMALRDLVGGRPKNLSVLIKRERRTMVTGLNQHFFKCFVGSPHVRFDRTTLYQGEWSGIPLFQELQPHGEGFVLFFDGWGFAREDKVLHLSIIAARHLNAADLGSSDPFCDIFCNERHLQTSVKWTNLNPIWNEDFQIDVTNPEAGLNIVVKDYDYIGDDDFLGQMVVQMKELADGKIHHKTFLLKGENLAETDDFDRGELEIRMQWTDRVYDQDVEALLARGNMACRLQAWARMLTAKSIRKHEAQVYAEKITMVRKMAVKVTNTCRIRLAKKELKRLQRRWKAALKIQKRIRIHIAKKIFFARLKRWRASISIQQIARGYLAKVEVKKRIKAKRMRFYNAAVAIQRRARFNYSKFIVNKLKEERREKLLANLPYGESELPSPAPVAEWINTYGYDTEYGLKRNRRMTETYFQRLLRHPYLRLKTRFGDCFVDRYPPLPPDAWHIDEGDEGGQEPTHAKWICEDFVQAHFPSQQPKYLKRTDVIEMTTETPRTALLYLPTSVSVRETVWNNVILIQCSIRQRQARDARRFMIKIHRAISTFQRIFRRRFWRQHKAAYLITALFRRVVATKFVALVRREFKGALCIQGAFRTWKAYLKMIELRSIQSLKILRCSSEIEQHEAKYCLDLKSNTFWLSDNPEFAELRVEMDKKEAIGEIWLMTSTLQCSPKYLTIGCVMNKNDRQYENMVNNVKLKNLAGKQWIILKFDIRIAKYWRVTFHGNYGDEHNIGIREIRFIRTGERSANIISQPGDILLKEGPAIGELQVVRLNCVADAWPLPKYQWRKNGKIVPGETSPELTLRLVCVPDPEIRSFRCTVCKNFSKQVPKNAYCVTCSNCRHTFDYKEINKYRDMIEEIYKKETDFKAELRQLIITKTQITSSKDSNFKSMLPFLQAKIDICENKLFELRCARVEIKEELTHCNKYDGEGVYTCLVTSVRGGSVIIRRISAVAIVAVESSKRFLLRTYPFYRARPQKKRSRWTIYESMHGTFYKGKPRGMTCIRFVDGHIYEGAYVDEESIGDDGFVPVEARAPNHWGIFKCNNGITYEGPTVDNHFDHENIQGHYLARMPNGDLYEGNFIDEHFFGPGKMKYSDGSEYEGEWHMGKISGYGMLRMPKLKWTYEGTVDDNQRNGEGINVWDDGAVYVGEWKGNIMEGRGIYISRLRDVYKGEFQNNAFEGKGECLYNNGGHYRGSFSKGFRHGEGHFIDNQGVEYLGLFCQDKKHGDFTVKRAIPPQEVGDEPGFEIQTGTYDMGRFINWATAAVNPNATKQFIRIFEEDREAFNSVYAMILAKYMPGAPNGIDVSNPQVAAILQRIRAESGMLVAASSYTNSADTLEELMPRIRAARKEIATLKETLDAMGLESIRMDKDKFELTRKFNNLMEGHGVIFQKIEQFWVDDRTEIRPRHQDAIEKLKQLKPTQWFKLKNHRIPPPFLKKIMDTVSMLLEEETDWKLQRQLLSDNVYNSIEGDADASRYVYDAKLVNVLGRYDIYEHARLDEARDSALSLNLTDPRFRRDSYYVESCGEAAPFIIDWIKANWAYKLTARKMLLDIKTAEAKKMQASRVKMSHSKLDDEQKALNAKLERLRSVESDMTEKLNVLLVEMIKHSKIINFVNDSQLLYRKDEKDFDYYEAYEKMIEDRRERLSVEGCMEDIVSTITGRHDREVEEKTRQMLAYGEVYVEPKFPGMDIRAAIADGVYTQQGALLTEGWHLGYSIEEQEYTLPQHKIQDSIDIIVDLVALNMNKVMNDILSRRNWILLNGTVISTRFIYAFAWTYWVDMARERELALIQESWEAIFIDPIMCARKALEALVNTKMSKVAREQGKVYKMRNPELIKAAEIEMSNEFDAAHGDKAAEESLRAQEDVEGELDPAVKIAAVCWAKFHPGGYNEIRDRRNYILAEEFVKKFHDGAALKAFEILNDIGDSGAKVYLELAEYWKQFHMDEYEALEKEEFARMMEDYRETNPVDTYKVCSKMLLSAKVHKYIRDDEVQEEHWYPAPVLSNARAWAVKNQGMVRKGTQALREEWESLATRQWFELLDVTKDWTKGSWLYVTDEDKMNIIAEKFFGFRQRLEKRYSWFFAFLCLKQEEIEKELENLLLEDPNEKIHHNIRPSKEAAITKAHEANYYKRKAETEKQYRDIISKVSAWNTYFGTLEERGLDKQEEEDDEEDA